jgi:hypothetical protein
MYIEVWMYPIYPTFPDSWRTSEVRYTIICDGWVLRHTSRVEVRSLDVPLLSYVSSLMAFFEDYDINKIQTHKQKLATFVLF